MKLSTFSIIWAALYGGFGLGLLLLPGPFMAVYGLDLDKSGELMSRILGSALFAFAIIFVLNRHVPKTEQVQRNILIGSVIYNVVDIPIVVMAIIGGVMSAMGWVPIGLHVFLAASMSYFAFGK